jgi:hypothetical protein
MHRYAPLVAVAAICCSVMSCHGPIFGDMAAAEANGVADIAEVREFVALCPQAQHVITHYSGTKGPTYWTSKAGIHGRYVLSVSFPIDFADAGRIKPTRTGEPVFRLVEMSEIRVGTDGSLEGSGFTKTQLTFGPEGWRRLVEAGGDLSVLGIKVVTDQPLEHFEMAWPRA